MLKICIVHKFKHVQIEFPDDMPHPKGRRGGRGSSLHLSRGTYRDVTEEELAHIQLTRPDVFSTLKIRRDSPIVSKRTLRKLEVAAAREADKTKAAAAKAPKKRTRKSK